MNCMKLIFDTKCAEHKSAGCQFFFVYYFFNCLFQCLNALATLFCSPWSKLRALAFYAGSSVKYTFYSEQSKNCDSFCSFIVWRKQLTKHMHKENSGHNLSYQKVICSQAYCQHNTAFFFFSIPILQNRNHSMFLT